MKLAQFQYLWILWIVPVLLFFFLVSELNRRRKTGKIISRELWNEVLPGLAGGRRRLKIFLLLCGVFFLCLAFLGPRWGYTLREFRRHGSDIYVVVDVSHSMRAEDISPNRMERAKRELLDLFRYIHGDRIGLVAFAGTAYVACPLTGDYDAFGLFVDQLDTDLMPVQGTNIGEALNLALHSFDSGKNRSRAVLLITDGEATLGSLSPVIDVLKKEEVRVFVIGMGDLKGAPIPMGEEGGFKTDKGGGVVISRLDETGLKNLALETGGGYVRSVTGDMDLEQIYLHGIKQVLEARELKSGKKMIPQERFQLPLLLAVFFIGLESIIKETRKEK